MRPLSFFLNFVSRLLAYIDYFFPFINVVDLTRAFFSIEVFGTRVPFVSVCWQAYYG